MRLDQWLVKNHKVRSRSQAEELIKRGDVCILDPKSKSWIKILKPSYPMDEDFEVENIKIESVLADYVARSGYKLNKSLQSLNINPEGLFCLDVGQSTGGFSQELLQSKAKFVVGLDVGKNQLSDELKKSTNLKSFENLDIRNALENSEFINFVPFDLAVVDVSFISLTQVLKHVVLCLKSGGRVIALVKPQFELSKNDLDKKGRVKQDSKYQLVEDKIKTHIAHQLKCEILDYIPSQLDGKEGNKEFFVHFKTKSI